MCDEEIEKKNSILQNKRKKLEAMASEEKISKLSEDKRKLRKKSFQREKYA